jgi:sensor c-di-GMP phosphodiesterase-like protein
MEFIPLAENTPLSGLMTYWVVDTVAAELGEWLRANRDAHISINVPPEILGRGGLEYVATKSGLMQLASQLIVEVTERGIPDPMGIEVLNTLRQWRITVALDDVTLAGGANLAVLARCQFDIIKLDRSLIAEIGPESSELDWLQGMTALLRSSRLQVIAEGVETEQQANALRASGIQYAQGYLFSRPLSADAFIAYHREARPGGTNQRRRLTGGA